MRSRVDVAAFADLLFPRACAGCAAPARRICEDCLAEIAGATFPGGAVRVAPTPVPPHLPPVWSAAAYDGPLTSCLSAYKDEGRADLAPVLALLLGFAVRRAALDLNGAGGAVAPPVVVPIPTSPRARRERGGDPLRVLARGAARHTGLAMVPALAAVRRHSHADSVGLGAAARAANLAGSFRAGAAVPPSVVLVDDILTTGATLAQAASVLRAHGARVVVAAVIATTPRRPQR